MKIAERGRWNSAERGQWQGASRLAGTAEMGDLTHASGVWVQNGSTPAAGDANTKVNDGEGERSRKSEPLRAPDFIMCSTVPAALAPSPSRSTFGPRTDVPRPEHQPGEQHRGQFRGRSRGRSRVTARKKASRVARPEIPAGRSIATSGGRALAFMAEGLSIDSRRCLWSTGTRPWTDLRTVLGKLRGALWSARSKFVRRRVSVMLGVGLGEGSVAHFLIARRPLLGARRCERAAASSRVSHFEGVSAVAGCGNEANQ